MEYFGLKLQTLRKKASMSQEDLANLVGVSRQAISKWERSEALPDLYNAKKIAEVFSITIDELMDIEIKSIDKEKEKNNKLALAFLTVPAVLVSVIAIVFLFGFVLQGGGWVVSYFFLTTVISIPLCIIYTYGLYNLYIGRLISKFKPILIVLNFVLLVGYLISLVSIGNASAGIIILLVILFIIIVLGIIGGFMYNIDYAVDKSEDYEDKTNVFKKLVKVIVIALGLYATVVIGYMVLTHQIDRVDEVMFVVNLKDVDEDTYMDCHVSITEEEAVLFIASDGLLPASSDIVRVEILFDDQVIHDSSGLEELVFLDEIVNALNYVFEFSFEETLELSGNLEVSIKLYTSDDTFLFESDGVNKRFETEQVVVPIWVNE